MADSRDLLFNLLGKETVSTAAKKAERSLEDLGDGFKDTERAANKLDRQIKDVDKSLTSLSTDSVTAETKKADRALADLGDEFKDAGRAADKLDCEISEVERTLKTLAVAFANTGDSKFTDRIRENERELRKLRKTSKLIGGGDGKGIGEELAENITVGFGAKFGPMMMRVVPQSLAKLGPIGGIIGGLIAVQVAGIIGASVSAAVVGGAGAVGIAGGLAMAAKDSRVQANAKSLAAEISGDLEIGAASFVGPAIKGLDILREGWRNVRGDVDKIFASTSQYVIPLARGMSAMFQNIMPGVRKAAEAAGPIFREIGNGLPRLGQAIGNLFSNLSKHASEGASAVRYLFIVLETGVNSISFVVGALSNLYRVIVEVNDVAATFAENTWGRLPVIGDAIKDSANKAHELKAALDDTSSGGETWGQELYNSIQRVTTQTQSATDAIKDYRSELQNAANANITADQAMIDLEASIDNATQSLKENGATLDINTPKGRANASALNDIATKANTAADAIYDQTGNQNDANNAAQRGRDAFVALAMKLGKTRAEAEALARTKIPDKTVKVNVQTQQAINAIATVQAGLGKINSKNIHIGVYYKTNGDLKLPGGTSTKNRWGGLYEKAQTGLLREARTYNATAPGRYMIAEPATGGEAFIPKRGNRDRSVKILQQAASWYGLGVTGGVNKGNAGLVGSQKSFAEALLAFIKKGKGVIYEDLTWAGMSSAFDDDDLRFGVDKKLGGLDFRKPAEMKKKLEAALGVGASSGSGSSPSVGGGSGGSSGGGSESTVRIIVEGTGVLAGLKKEIRVRGGNVQKVLGS